jgi:DNA processing protein
MPALAKLISLEGADESADAFGPLLRQESLRRGLGSVGKVVVLIGGVAGLESMGRLCFKDGLQIVDFFHALEHAGLVLAVRVGKKHPDYKKRLRRWAQRLLKDQVQALIEETRQPCAGQPPAAAVELSASEQKVYDTLDHEERGMDEVLRACGLPSSAVSVALLSLEMRRLVRQLPGKRFVKNS